MGISNKIKVATISADETTTYEIKAMIALPFIHVWQHESCDDTKDVIFSLSFSHFRCCHHGCSSSLTAYYAKQLLICNNFLHKTDNLMVSVQRNGHPQLWVPIEKLLDGRSKLSGKIGGSFLKQTQTQERVHLWKIIFPALQASVSGLKIRWQPPPRNTTANQWH